MALTGFGGFIVPDEKYLAITTPLITNSGVKDIFIAEDRYAIIATGSGVDVLDLECAAVISSGTIFGTEVVSVVADPQSFLSQVYIGTSTSGIYSMNYNLIRIPETDFTNQLLPIYSTTSSPAISSNEIRDLAVDRDPGFLFRLLISTSSGIDLISSQGGAAVASCRPLISGSDSCLLTAAGEGYWSATNSGVEVSYDLYSSSGTGIIVTDFEYSPSSTPSIPSNTINDIDVAEGSPNVLGFATASGDIVISELQGSEVSSATKTLFSQEPVVSVNFGPDAGYSSGKLYILATGTALVFDLADSSEIGSHHHTIAFIDEFLQHRK